MCVAEFPVSEVCTTCSYRAFFQSQVLYSRLSALDHYSLNAHVPSVEISSKFWKKNTHSDILSTERDQPYKEENRLPSLHLGERQQQINFHNKSENSNHGEHHPYYFRDLYLIQNLDRNFYL